jgi:hypothetical protein
VASVYERLETGSLLLRCKIYVTQQIIAASTAWWNGNVGFVRFSPLDGLVLKGSFLRSFVQVPNYRPKKVKPVLQ